MRALCIFLLLSLSACGSTPVVHDAGLDDAGHEAGVDASADAGVDAGPDAGLDSGADASLLDSGVEPIGVVTGECGVLDDEITDTTMSFFVRDAMRFDETFSSADGARVSAGAREILADGTAGGSSGYSEAFAFEVLYRCEGASLIKSETEILYDVPGSLTDILVEIDGQKIGVSVTRAVSVTGPCTREGTYDEAVAEELLTRKLLGIQESSMNVSAEDRWLKQILFVFADTDAHADTLRTVWDRLDPTVRADTILLVSVSEGLDGFIYFEDRCPP